MKGILAVLSLFSLLVSNQDVLARPAKDVAVGGFSSFKIEVRNNGSAIAEDIVFDNYGDSLLVGIIPYQVNQFHLIASYVTTSDIIKVAVGGVVQQTEISSNDFSQPIEYVLTSTASSRKVKAMLIYTGLPVIYVSTENNAPVVSKDDYLNGQIKIYPNSSDPIFNAPTQIRGRGNSTWEMPKKPYKIKLNTKAGLLGMPADKEWVLLANYSDKTLLRTSVAFELSHRLGMAYEPRSKHVELVLNGKYMGNYLLCEQIKVAKKRVDIKEMKTDDEDVDEITGGYLMEIDFRKDADFWFETEKNIPFAIKSPEAITPSQLEYIHSYVQETEDVLFSPSFADPVNGYSKYIDVNSFIDWYWVNELFKTPDAVFLSSVYIYKDRNGKLKLGPVWDFDVSSGNINNRSLDNPGGWWIKSTGSVWINQLFRDPTFQQKAYDRWNELKQTEIETLLSFVDEKAGELKVSQQQNFRRWPILNSWVWPNAVVTGSYEGEIAYLKDWLTKRIIWIDYQINQPPLQNFNLVTPVAHQRLEMENRADVLIEFKWEPSVPGVTYRWMLEGIAGGFSTPLLLRQSSGFGFEPKISVRMSDIYLALSLSDIKKGDSIKWKWTVAAKGATNSVYAVQPFEINLIRKRILSDFSLITPEDNVSVLLDLDNISDIQPINFSWQSSKNASNYRFLLLDGDSDHVLYQSPLLKNNQTSFVLSGEDQSRIFSAKALPGNLRWLVKAYEKEDSISSIKNFRLRFSAPPIEVVNGIEDSSTVFEIYPNPGNGTFFVPDSFSFSHVMVRDLRGVMVSDLQLTGDNKIDLSQLSQGIYIVQLKQGLTTHRYKLVIDK